MPLVKKQMCFSRKIEEKSHPIWHIPCRLFICFLCVERKNIVFGVGTPEGPLLLIRLFNLLPGDFYSGVDITFCDLDTFIFIIIRSSSFPAFSFTWIFYSSLILDSSPEVINTWQLYDLRENNLRLTHILEISNNRTILLVFF